MNFKLKTVSKEVFYSQLSKIIQIPISDKTIFFDGVGLSGLDADEFINLMHTKYGVDFTDFNYRNYYVADGANFIRLLLDRFYKTKKIPSKIFTGAHLFSVVEKGKWFDP